MDTIRNKMTKFAIWLGAISILASWLMAGSFVGKVDAADNDITVRVLLFSGRPDPVYTLDDAGMIEKLKAGLKNAKTIEKFDEPTIIPSILGYKGIFVRNPQKIAGLPAQFALYDGMVEIRDGQQKFLADTGRKMENMLLDEAVRKGVIEESILKRMKREKQVSE